MNQCHCYECLYYNRRDVDARIAAWAAMWEVDFGPAIFRDQNHETQC